MITQQFIYYKGIPIEYIDNAMWTIHYCDEEINYDNLSDCYAWVDTLK